MKKAGQGGLKKTLLGVAIAIGICGMWIYPRHTVPILMYHYVNDGHAGSLSVTPENFERQMKYLKDRGYAVISLDAFIEGKRLGRDFARNTVVITFDDGWEDNYTKAFPILKKYEMPATIFLISQLVGQAPYLHWDQIREMSAHGIDFGSHTRTHAYVPNLNQEQLLEEALSSKQEIEMHLGRPVKHFCYPLGGFREESKDVLRQAGYLSAVTTNRGSDRQQQDLYAIRRIKVTNSDAVKPLSFWAKLSGYFYLFRMPKLGY